MSIISNLSNLSTDDGSDLKENNNNDSPSKIAQFASSLAEKSKSESLKAIKAAKIRLSLEGQLKQARISLQKYVNPKIFKKSIKEDTLIPKWVLKRAKGIVFLTVFKAGFLFAANIGTGCVIVRNQDGTWTGPSSIGVAGISFGLLAGASKVDYIMILPNASAVQQFTGKGQLRLGGEIQLALGPLGRDANGSIGAGDKGVSVVYSYSHAKGLYGGIALDGKVIVVRNEANKDFYDRHKVSCADILHGKVQCPVNEDYDMVVHLLDSYCLGDDLAIPVRGERVSVTDLNQNVNGNTREPKNDVNENVNNNDNFSSQMQRQYEKMANQMSVGFEHIKKCIADSNESDMVEVQENDIKNKDETVGQ